MEKIPQYAMCAGYTMRSFRDGDRQTWLSVEEASETFGKITGQSFDGSFCGDLRVLRRRMFFLVGPDGRDCGTISAWYDRRYRRMTWGRIHWLAITPAHRGKGLSKAMMTYAMNRLKAFGHRRAMLATQTPRIAAIKTYLDFGFVPDMTAEDAECRWAMVREVISHPAIDKALRRRKR
jgi:GNAT superfamily N-acetyltransferase